MPRCSWPEPGTDWATDYCLQLADDCAHDGTRLKIATLSDSASQLWDVKQPA